MHKNYDFKCLIKYFIYLETKLKIFCIKIMLHNNALFYCKDKQKINCTQVAND